MMDYSKLPNYWYKLENKEDLKKLLKKCYKTVNQLYKEALAVWHDKKSWGKEMQIYFNQKREAITWLLKRDNEEEMIARYKIFHYYLKDIDEWHHTKKL